MNPSRPVVWGSLVAILLLVALLVWNQRPAAEAPVREPLVVYCAAGLRPAVEAAVDDYGRERGVPVQIQYGGSGTLLSNLRVAGSGDLFLPGDSSFIDAGRSNGLLAEVVPLARMRAVVAVARGNPKALRSVRDLLRDGVRVSLGNPDSVAIGAVARAALLRSGEWPALASRALVFKPTVNDVANDVKVGAVDAGIVWDATAAQYPEIEAVRAPEFAGVSSEVSVAVLRSCGQAPAALAFARYLGARDRGLGAFARAGYAVVAGDAWKARPEVVVYSGAVNRPALEPLLAEFEAREGVLVNTVYNGCGILTAQIRSGQRPDAYLACDTSFMTTVSNVFGPATNVSRTSLVLLVRRGNPLGVRTLEDLGRPGLRVGLAQEQQSALGALTARVLRARGLLERVRPNVRVETPTGDLLVNQMRGGGLDVAVVYAVNARSAREALDFVPVEDAEAVAIQPYAVSQATANARLMERLGERLRSASGRARLEEAGFQPQ